MLEKNRYVIFLVEDDEMYRQMLQDHFRGNFKKNVEVHAFPGGETCLDNMSMNPDIVILDYNLDKSGPAAMNGIDVLKRIKAARPETQVIMLSGQDKIQVAVDTLKFGAYDYVVKSESAFLRAQNIIRNLIYNVNLRYWLKLQKLLTWVLMGVIVIIAIATVYLRITRPDLFFIK